MTLLLEKTIDLPTPEELFSSYPISERAEEALLESRRSIFSILRRKDPRHLLIVGPCSLNDEESALDYGRRLSSLAHEVKDSFVIVMRAYFEKARSHLGWKGLLHDPLRDGSGQIHEGLFKVRALLRELAEIGLPLGAEILSPYSPVYFSDLLSWGCIGARTTTSQIHREIASSLPFAVGFKNTIDGDMQAAISGMSVATHSHTYLGVDERGQLKQMASQGNEGVHLVLRGGESGPNYDGKSIEQAVAQLKEEGLFPSILVDCAHDNCQKDLTQQKRVFESVIKEIGSGQSAIAGLMLESFLYAGSQPLSSSRYGLSLTDPCLGWEESEGMILEAHHFLRKRI